MYDVPGIDTMIGVPGREGGLSWPEVAQLAPMTVAP